jgi:hypothetical protein
METNLERCPLCESELSQTKYREIRAKLRNESEKKAAELAEAKSEISKTLEQEFKQQLEQQRRATEKKLRDEAEQLVKKATAERDQVTIKLKAAEAREVEIRKQAQMEIETQRLAAEKKAKADSEQQVKKLTAERDQNAKKLKDAEARETEIRKQATQEADKRNGKELADQRQALEKDRSLALLKQQSEFNRQRESFQKKIQVMENQLQRKTANELGDGGEIDVFEIFRTFDGSGGKTTRVPKGQSGADFLHEVFYKGQPCGRIIIDAKNRQAWQNVFVTKLRQDQVEAGAEHAILVTTVFPSGKKDMCIESGVIVISPAQVTYIVQVLRQSMITMHVRGLSLKERADKMSRLYKLITSESHAGKLTEAGRLTQDILELDVQEKKSHDNVWKKRGSLSIRIRNVLREMETEIAAVIEGDANERDAQVLSMPEGKPSAMGSAN